QIYGERVHEESLARNALARDPEPIELGDDELQVLPYLALRRRVAQEERRVEGRHERDALVGVEAAAQARDGGVAAQEALGGELAEADDHARPDGGELLLEERLAGGDLVRLGVAVARRAALDDVGDVDVLARKAHRLDHLREQLAGGADERLAGAVLLGA